MSEVKRYSFWPQIVHLPGGGGVRAEVHFKVEEDGLFVAHQDYDRLKAEVERLDALCKQLMAQHSDISCENIMLRKAGDELGYCLAAYMNGVSYKTKVVSECFELWQAAKDGKDAE